jgi:hypothetical protein
VSSSLLSPLASARGRTCAVQMRHAAGFKPLKLFLNQLAIAAVANKVRHLRCMPFAGPCRAGRTLLVLPVFGA